MNRQRVPYSLQGQRSNRFSKSENKKVSLLINAYTKIILYRQIGDYCNEKCCQSEGMAKYLGSYLNHPKRWQETSVKVSLI